MMTSQQFQGLIRHTLTFIGGILVVKGVFTEAFANEITGSILALISTIWSYQSKK
jgi:hypothetical protein